MATINNHAPYLAAILGSVSFIRIKAPIPSGRAQMKYVAGGFRCLGAEPYGLGIATSSEKPRKPPRRNNATATAILKINVPIFFCILLWINYGVSTSPNMFSCMTELTLKTRQQQMTKLFGFSITERLENRFKVIWLNISFNTGIF
jgi:hypothetical protein